MSTPVHPADQAYTDASPPATPSHALLQHELPAEKNIELKGTVVEKPFVPWPLRTWFWLPFVVFLTLAAVGLEVAFHFSRKNNGWETNGDFSNTAGVMHYVYTLPPVIVATIIAGLWAWTDLEIKKLQPYVDLVHGDSPPERSLLLDYSRTNTFFAPTHALRNRHYLVALASLMVLVSLTLSPLSAALLVVRDVWWVGEVGTPDTPTVTSTMNMGLNQNVQFDDLTEFLAAAGYASASVQYGVPAPSWVMGPWTVRGFNNWPPDTPINGTVLSVNTTAVMSAPGCRPVQVQMTNHSDGSGWTNAARLEDGCGLSWEVDHSAESLFGTDVLNCSSSDPESRQFTPFAPVVFWFFTYQPEVASSATFCYPSVELWDVGVELELKNMNISKVTQRQRISVDSITGPPLNGRAFNGIQFNLTEEMQQDAFVLARMNATQLTMPAAVWEAARQSVGGNILDAFNSGRFVGLAESVYTTYLTILAKTLYYVPLADNERGEQFQVQVRTTRKRLFLSDVATHLLAAALFILAVFAAIVQFLHRYDRRYLTLRHEPGTIASAVSVGAGTEVGNLLASSRTGAADQSFTSAQKNASTDQIQRNKGGLNEVLANRRFRYDPVLGKIVMEGEEGYQWEKPKNRESWDGLSKRNSVLGLGRGVSFSAKRASRPPPGPAIREEDSA